MRTNFHMLLNFKMATHDQMSGFTVESEYSDLISVSQRSSTVGRPRNSPVWDYFSYFPDKGKKGESMCEVMMLKLKPGGMTVYEVCGATKEGVCVGV